MAIEHTVVFRLNHELGSKESEQFLADAFTTLTAIPGVENFKIFRQISPKSDLDFQFSMSFRDQSDYDSYNLHPLHVAFVSDRWVPEVAEFQEFDFVEM